MAQVGRSREKNRTSASSVLTYNLLLERFSDVGKPGHSLAESIAWN